MSSFICDPEHFASALASLILLQENKSGLPKPYRVKWQENIQASEVSAKIEGYINTLARLQITCVNLQYKHHEGYGVRCIPSQVKFYTGRKHRAYDLTHHGLHKALTCILYQIETEHLEKIRPLNETEKAALQWANTYKAALAESLLSHTPEWKKAEWTVSMNAPQADLCAQNWG